MKFAKAGAAIGALVMAVALVYGFTLGDGWDEVRVLTRYPWFNVSLVDVYVGFLLIGGWIAWREASAPRAAMWIILILIGGNLVSCLYVLGVLHASRGDWNRFWHGRRVTRDMGA
jgi:hypothetical protein